jgi:hypothetical protein
VLYIKVKNIKNEKSKNDIEKNKSGKTDKLFKIKEFFKWVFCIIDIEEIFNGYIAKIPIKRDNLSKIVNNIRNSIITNKIRKIINEKSIDGIVLSDEIKKNTEFMDKLLNKKSNNSNKNKSNISKVNYKKNLDCIIDEHNIAKHFIKQRNVFFINGNGLFKYIIYEILVYIINIQNRKAELEDVFIVANNIDEIILDNIIFLSTKFKNINIVSKNIEKYRYIEDIVYNNTGNNVILLNNKRKSLKRAKFIVNVDNSINELNEYLIYRKAIIINLNDEINNKDKSIIQDTKEHVNQDTTKKRKIVTLTGFEGIFVNSYEIDVNNRIKEFFKKYGLIYETSITILYESFLNKKENFSNMRSKIEDAGIIIKKLYGNNGIIDENEYKRVNLSDNEVKKRY